MEVENPLEDNFPLQTGGFPLPCLFQCKSTWIEFLGGAFSNRVALVAAKKFAHKNEGPALPHDLIKSHPEVPSMSCKVSCPRSIMATWKNKTRLMIGTWSALLQGVSPQQ